MQVRSPSPAAQTLPQITLLALIDGDPLPSAVEWLGPVSVREEPVENDAGEYIGTVLVVRGRVELEVIPGALETKGGLPR